MHIPVLQKEVIQYLNPQPNENFIDCTIGEGGHTTAILEKTGPAGKILGIDADQEQIKNLKFKIKNFEKRIVLVSDNFANLEEIVKNTKFGSVQGILFDLGMSIWHLEESKKGFSFLKDEPLDMRYGFDNPLTANEIINFWSEDEVRRILKDFGEESFVARIASEIIKERKVRKIETTAHLVRVIGRAIPVKYQHQRTHFATRTFQALRIAVNEELSSIEKALPQALSVLKEGGRIAVISFHSLEDRIVKNFFRDNKKELNILTKKPIIPTQEEIINNNRCRSSKMRVAQKI